MIAGKDSFRLDRCAIGRWMERCVREGRGRRLGRRGIVRMREKVFVMQIFHSEEGEGNVVRGAVRRGTKRGSEGEDLVSGRCT